ncbi:MAG: SUMF1/EgtB/PvdO family nonheme iron enzyme [Nitrospirales bacterium]
MPDRHVLHDIFLSYASEDRERVTPIARTLESLGWRVWWDRRIPTGKRYAQVIEEQLDASRTVVVVWSKTSIQSDWVHTEADEGLRRDVLFPIRIDDVRPPFEFRRIQAADLMQWQGNQDDDQWRLLIDDLASVPDMPKPSSQIGHEEEQEKKTSISEKTKSGAKSKNAGTSRTTPAGSWKEQSKPGGHTRKVPDGMVLIPNGLFLYGDEKKTVVLDLDYYMDIHPVTNAPYRKFIEAGGYDQQSYWSPKGWNWGKEKHVTQPASWDDEKFNRPDQPVVGVSYYEAEAYAKWAGKRLPTEQEWEKAARGMDGQEYPWGNEFLEDRCASSVGKQARDRTTPVGSYPDGKSPFGCQDMAGNVWEWCASWYYADEDTRVLRGGSWAYDVPEFFRCAYRNNYFPGVRSSVFGFRCAQDAP